MQLVHGYFATGYYEVKLELEQGGNKKARRIIIIQKNHDHNYNDNLDDDNHDHNNEDDDNYENYRHLIVGSGSMPSPQSGASTNRSLNVSYFNYTLTNLESYFNYMYINQPPIIL